MRFAVKFQETSRSFPVNFGVLQTVTVPDDGIHGIPPGGKAGQFLRKRSDADHDVEWSDFVIPEQYGLVSYDQDKTITIT